MPIRPIKVTKKLEPEPQSWLVNPRFPCLWSYLFYDICRRDNVLLLSFELNSKDEAFVVERAYIEDELYRESKGLGEFTRESMSVACHNYFNSRIPAWEYNQGVHNYVLPQLAIWSVVNFNRLKVEKRMETKKFWEDVLAKQNFTQPISR